MTSNLVEVKAGKIAENTLLATDDSRVFLEFPREIKFVNTEAKTSFEGEILQPQVIELNVPKPRGLMRELITFELVSSTGAEVHFLDDYKFLYQKPTKPTDPEKSPSLWVKLIYVIKKDTTKLPKLWQWQGEKDKWRKIGGAVSKNEESSKNRVFTVSLDKTGIYSIFDENPAPEHFADEYKFYEKPVAPTNDNSEIAEEPSFSDLTSDKSFGETGEILPDPKVNSDFEIVEDFHSAGYAPDLETEIPSLQSSENQQMLTEIEQKIAGKSLTSEQENQIAELKSLFKKQKFIETEIADITNSINEISAKITEASTPQERENLDKTFLDLQTRLFALKKEELQNKEQSQILEQQIKEFLREIPAAENLGKNLEASVIENSEPATNSEKITTGKEPQKSDFYLPQNSVLPQSGGEENTISWYFPVFLIFCLAVLGWGIFAGKKAKGQDF